MDRPGRTHGLAFTAKLALFGIDIGHVIVQDDGSVGTGLGTLMADVVVASVGQSPRRSTKVGFSLKKPLVKIFSFLLLIAYSPLMVLKASTAFLTAREYALEVMVEAVIASTSPPSFLTERIFWDGSNPLNCE